MSPRFSKPTANTAPERAPKVKIGRKMPPGNPEPKDNILQMNLIAK